MTKQTIPQSRYLDALQERVLIYDGAMGTSLQAQNLSAEQFGGEQYNGCNDYLVLSYPQAVEKVHRSFLEVGVDVIETCTFRANRLTLADYGLGQRVDEINRAAAQLARRLADEYSSDRQPRFVAGSMGPSGKLLSVDDPELSNTTFDELVDVFREQAVGLIQGGVDLLLIETSQDILEVKAAILGIQQAFAETGVSLPIQAQVTLDTTGRMLLGTDAPAVLTILEGLPIDVIGLNCSTGPDYMREPIRYLGEQSRLPVSCIPNAGLPLNVDGQAVYPLEPEPFASTLAEFVEKFHINVVGGCCGTTPAHLKLLVEKLHGKPRPARPILDIPRLASSTQSVPMLQEPKPFLIGERLNAQGSRKFKKFLLSEDFDSIITLARQQVDGGAHGLDVCVAVTERPDEGELMRRVVKGLSSAVRVPLVIDTTEPDVMEAALKAGPRAQPDQLHQSGSRAGQVRAHLRPGGKIQRGGDRPDHRRAGHGQDRRAQAGDRPAHLRYRREGVRPAPVRPGLRCADLHAGHRRRGVQQLGGGNPGRHPPHQKRAARRADLAGRQQRLASGWRRRRAPCSTASCCITPCRPAWTWPSSTRRRSHLTPRSAKKSASSPKT